MAEFGTETNDFLKYMAEVCSDDCEHGRGVAYTA